MSSTGDVNVGAYIGIIYPLLLVVCALTVFLYAEPGFPWHTYITLTCGYFASFGILFLVPIDIASIVIARRSTASIADSGYNDYIYVLSGAYSTFFGLVLVLGSIVLGFEEYYNTDGYFTILSKLWSSFKRMLFDTLPGVIVGVIILGILIGQKIVPSDANALQLAAVIVTNTVYETVLMFILGYGLVELPRSLWENSNLEGYLLKTQSKAAYEFKKISDAQLEISLVVADVIKTKEQLASYANQQLNEAMTIIQSECPTEFRSSRLGNVATNKSGQVTIDTLAALRTRLNTAKDRYRMTQATSEGTKLLSYYLEDLVAAKAKGDGVIYWSLLKKESTRNEYRWHIVYWPMFLKFAAFCVFTMSVLCFVGVVFSTKGVSTRTAPFYKAVHESTASSTGIVFFIFFTLGYTSYATVWSLFQMKLVGTVEMVPGRTTPESLSFNVRMCARLAAPLAFFYLSWIAEDGLQDGPWVYSSTAPSYVYENVTSFDPFTNSTITSIELVEVSNQQTMPSAFSNFYQLQNIGFFRKSFGVIFPVIFFCVVGLILPNVLNRILVLLRLPNFQFGAQIVTEEQLREGKRQLERHKAHTARTFQRGLLRDYIATLAKRDTKDGNQSGVIGGLFGKLRKGKPETKMDPAGAVLVEPTPVAGLIEKKGTASYGIGSGWVELLAEISPPNTLVFKDKKTSALESSVDLRTIIQFHEHKGGKDNKQLDLELATSTVILRFKTVEDQLEWKTALEAWKDYAIDYANLYPSTRAQDVSVDSKGSIQSASADNRNSNSVKRNSNTKSVDALDELDAIVVDDNDDEPVSRGSKPLISGNFLGFGKKKKEETGLTAQLTDSKPPPLEGWLEKKSGAKVQLGNEWQRRYVRIDEASASLLYYKTSAAGEKPAGSLDLRLAVDISPYDKGKGDVARFNIDFGEGEKVYKFKAASASEGERWVKSLNDWRDYFLLRSV